MKKLFYIKDARVHPTTVSFTRNLIIDIYNSNDYVRLSTNNVFHHKQPHTVVTWRYKYDKI